ncbi:MAG: TIGR02281 family clan AA aspartic protease [Mariprofundaceae bacterium]|nr:TIGR02281 family clan AA aspartic protease [Mariprofundaceae bacterium]
MSLPAYAKSSWVRDADGNITNVRFDDDPLPEKKPIQKDDQSKEADAVAEEPAQRVIWKWKDAKGHVHFSDKKESASAHEFKAKRKLNVVGNYSKRQADSVYRIAFRQMGEAMIIKGEVNGVSLDFVLDTGASLVIIPPSVAQRTGVKIDLNQRILLQTASGKVNAPAVTLAEVKLGFLAQKNIEAAVQNIGIPNTGLLGMSFLKAYNITISKQSKELILEKK